MYLFIHKIIYWEYDGGSLLVHPSRLITPGLTGLILVILMITGVISRLLGVNPQVTRDSIGVPIPQAQDRAASQIYAPLKASLAKCSTARGQFGPPSWQVY